MFKTVVTLFRGSVAAAGEELEDRTALLILDQQMRDAAAAVERGKRTLALAIARTSREAASSRGPSPPTPISRPAREAGPQAAPENPATVPAKPSQGRKPIP